MAIFKKLTSVAACVLGTGLFAPSSNAGASAYPDKPVTIYVGFAAGGPTDVVARLLAEGLTHKFRQSVVIENRPGASGELAANLLKKATPDGYTLMIGANGTLSILPEVRKTIQYQPLRDFVPIAPVARFPYYLAVSKESTFSTYDDLVKYGRSHAKGLTFGSAGPGSANHLAGEWFAKAAGMDAIHVPYKGDAAALNDLIANRVDFAFLAGSVVIPQVEADKIRLIASASSSPDIGLQGIPVLGRDELPGFTAEPWNGLLGPAGLPSDIVQILNAAVNEVMTSPNMKERLKKLDQYPFTGSVDVFADHIRKQSAQTADLVRTLNLTIEQ